VKELDGHLAAMLVDRGCQSRQTWDAVIVGQ
jgi:hypothetical protein